MNFEDFFDEISKKDCPFELRFRQLSKSEKEMVRVVYKGLFSRILKRFIGISGTKNIPNLACKINMKVDGLASDKGLGPLSILEKVAANMDGGSV